jgi:hypothetical protein
MGNEPVAESDLVYTILEVPISDIKGDIIYKSGGIIVCKTK